MKRITFIVISLYFVLLVGCSSSDNTQWYETKETAIEYGLQEEGTDKTSILSIEEFKGETIVFYELDNSLGVANIAESKKGFSFFRNTSYVGFGGDSAHSKMGFDFKTKSGVNVNVLAGKASDKSIEKMKLLGDGLERELPISEKSRLFYVIHEEPYTSLEVIPITNYE
ncbi:hypothetical protein [Alkalihalobacillus deserti]|uniref:hypothetical protein n=1 Tax=Alkalihalobacillus deserti TaxID=2879466 RepID=UPI001D146C68|nr:hypothetical protein [Alkalihalobacillus deserti]